MFKILAKLAFLQYFLHFYCRFFKTFLNILWCYLQNFQNFFSFPLTFSICWYFFKDFGIIIQENLMSLPKFSKIFTICDSFEIENRCDVLKMLLQFYKIFIGFPRECVSEEKSYKNLVCLRKNLDNFHHWR